MWERDTTLRAAGRLVTGLREGRGGALFVIGEAGLGKTTVLDGARRGAVAAGVHVVLARGDAMEASVPFGVVTQIIREFGGREAHRVDMSLPGPERRAAHFVTVLRWLEDVAVQPLLLALDDLHSADADSVELLAFLCRRLHRMPVAVIGTMRPWPADAQRVVVALADAGHADLERLAPLSEVSAGRLLAESSGGQVDGATAERAWRLCGGNPLLLEQVALYLRRGEEIPLALDEAAAPALTERLLLGRFAGLADAGLRCARGASVLGSQFRIEVAAAVAGLGEAEVGLAGEALVRSGLVRPVRGDMVEFAHPLFSQALYADLTPPGRSRLHERAFEVLRGLGRDAEAAEQAVRGGLVGSPPALALIERVGRSAARRGAVATASRLLESAVQLAGDRASPDLLQVTGEATLSAGGRSSTIATLERLVQHPEADLASRTAALRLLARARWLGADFDAAAACWEDGAELAAPDQPALAAECLLDYAQVLGLVCRTAESLEVATRARALAQRGGAALSQRAEAIWGLAALLTGDPSGIEPMAETVRGLRARPPSHSAAAWGWSALAVYAIASRYVERFADAEQLMAHALASAEHAGAPGMVCAIATVQADTMLRLGRLDEALRLAERATGLADLEPSIEAHAWVTLAAVHLHLGDLDRSEACCDRADGFARQRAQLLAVLQVCDVRGRCLLGRGQPERAREVFLRAEEISRFMRLGEPCVVPWAGPAITAHASCGAHDDAARVISWLEDAAEALPCRWPRIAAATGRAILAERRGDLESAHSFHERAVTLHREVTLPLERIASLIEQGSFLRRGGAPARARPLLAEAVRHAQQLGARGLAERALADLRVAGGRRPRRSDPHRLTAQEARVTRLAAEGHTNQEIGRLLSLSTSTVKTHLERAFAKLQVRSRRELGAAYLAAGGEEGVVAGGRG
ncbi:MAG TPA: AAA family ATPase [Candidatus Dormibacteraeota bacterium]|nr:AAA family ATPase [Candidatus Dormibacteraeota bacterium]